MQERDTLREQLWSDAPVWSEDSAERRAMVLEQYKLCLELADRISQRRAATNTFFLTFHTAVIGGLAAFYDDLDPRIAEIFFGVSAAICGAWWLLLRSYRTLNTAKFRVIGALEEHLPASPLYKAEWEALGRGENWRTHIPFTPIEQIVPVGFALLYLFLLGLPPAG